MKSQSANYALLYMAISILFPATALSQVNGDKIALDTVHFSGYTLIRYKVFEDGEYWMQNFDIYLCEKKLLASITWYPPPELYTFCYHSQGEGFPCAIRDINNDRKGEIIINIFSGGSGGNEAGFIYTLDTVATEIGVFNGIETDLGPFGLEDIDGDTCMEVVMWDTHNNYWPYGNGANGSINLVWRWDGKKYRLGNFKMADQILKNVNHLNPDSLSFLLEKIKNNPDKISNFNPAIESNWPPELMELMLALIYTNKAPLAEKACEYSWQKGDTTRNIYERLFWDHVKSGPHWEELQKSDW